MRLLALIACVTFLLVPGRIQAAEAADSAFPLFPCIAANVAFWKKIYGEYSEHQAVIHDRNDLGRIYRVITIMDRDMPLAARINRELIRQSVEDIEAMLKDLAAGKKPETAEARRIAAMFKDADPEVLREAAGNIRVQSGLKERFLAGVLRSGAWMDQIRAVMREYGLPEELAYLPHVESSFRQDAHSRSGAVGAWQFTASTGRRYLRVDRVIDERRDVILAARGAAKYLRDSYAYLQDWPLALTSYNYGRAGMIRAKEAHGGYEEVWQNFKGRRFGFASRNFYPEFLAALAVARELEQRHAAEMARPVAHPVITLPGYVSLADACRHLGVSRKDLLALNPAIGPAVRSGQRYIPKGFTLRLPPEAGTGKQVAVSLPAKVLHKAQRRDRHHVVRRGDTAGKIAARYRVSLKKLIRVNRLDSRATIYVGQKLKIPSS